ncbi:MAG: DUF4118 domain-containing protein [Lachnospiraceae bacterium]
MSMEEQKGKLKIFLGYAAGVGKTYAMLEAAHALQNQKVDVAAGYLEPHERPETITMSGGIEQVEPMLIAYKGIHLKELNLDGCMARHPDILLVDELAHTNAQGCRHRKRYQDIEELLKAGINVYTTVNIQHLESLNDLITGITKIRVRERIPDSVFDKAFQVELVDIEPDDLLQRLREGKVYKRGQAERAMENFFAKEKLIALREIALRRMADRVNRLAEEEHPAVSREYFVGEHILTCVSASPTNAKVIRTASRLAYAFHGEFTALYVETPEMQNAEPDRKRLLEANLQLARDLGAKIATIYGEDIAFQIAEYAKVSNVSKVVIGRANHKNYFGSKKGTVVERLTKYAPALDTYIIPDGEPSKPYQQHKKVHGTHAYVEKLTGKNTLKTVARIVASTAIGSFFTVLYFSFQAYGRSYPVTFLVMFLVALLGFSLTERLQKQNRESAKKAYRTELLLEHSRKLRRAKNVDEVLEEMANQTLKLINLPVLIYIQRSGKMIGPKVFPKMGMKKGEMKDYIITTERAVAQWVIHNHHRAGACTSTLPGAKAIYLPIQDHEKVFAVVGIVLEERREIPSFEYGLLTAMLNETALVLGRFLSSHR